MFLVERTLELDNVYENVYAQDQVVIKDSMLKYSVMQKELSYFEGCLLFAFQLRGLKSEKRRLVVLRRKTKEQHGNPLPMDAKHLPYKNYLFVKKLPFCK